MTEPFALLPERIHLELPEVEVVLTALDLMEASGHPDAAAATALKHAIYHRLWPELGDL